VTFVFALLLGYVFFVPILELFANAAAAYNLGTLSA